MYRIKSVAAVQTSLRRQAVVTSLKLPTVLPPASVVADTLLLRQPCRPGRYSVCAFSSTTIQDYILFSRDQHDSELDFVSPIDGELTSNKSNSNNNAVIDNKSFTTKNDKIKVKADLETAISQYKHFSQELTNMYQQQQQQTITCDNIDTDESAAADRRAVLRGMAQSIKDSHKALEKLEPVFAQPYRPIGYAFSKIFGNKITNVATDEQSVANNDDPQGADSQNKKDIAKAALFIIQAYADCLKLARDTNTKSRATYGFSYRAQQLLQYLPEHYIPPRSLLTDNTIVDNASNTTRQSPFAAVLQAWAFSGEPMQGSQADDVFYRLTPEKYRDADAYRWVVYAWLNSRNEDSVAFNGSSHLLRWMSLLKNPRNTVRTITNGGDSIDREPDIDVYRDVFEAWSWAKDKTSPHRANVLLKQMVLYHSQGAVTVKPDLPCFCALLKTIAGRPELPKMGRLADNILSQMQNKYQIIPDEACYSAAIKIWKDAALDPSVSFHSSDIAVRRCLSLLKTMQQADQRTTLFSINVQTSNVNDVLEALSVSLSSSRFSKAESLLQDLECGAFGKDVSANPKSYQRVLQIAYFDKPKEQLYKATELLNRFQSNWLEPNVEKLDGNETLCNDVVALFNSVLRVYSSIKLPKDESLEHRMDLFKQALAATEILRKYPALQLNSTTYSILLQCSNNLLGDDVLHAKSVIEGIFTICCREGLVDGAVLNIFRECTMTEQFHRMVVSKHEIIEGVPVVPEDWTRNVLGGDVKFADGRRTTPLDLSGNLFLPRAHYDFRMRRVREKRNRRLLEGGRLRQRPTYFNPFQEL